MLKDDFLAEARRWSLVEVGARIGWHRLALAAIYALTWYDMLNVVGTPAGVVA